MDAHGVRGASDWIVDVLSPATASHDQIVKVAAYEQAGECEVWLVHSSDRGVSVYTLDRANYGRATIHRLDSTLGVTSVSKISIDLGRFGSA